MTLFIYLLQFPLRVYFLFPTNKCFLFPGFSVLSEVTAWQTLASSRTEESHAGASDRPSSFHRKSVYPLPQANLSLQTVEGRNAAPKQSVCQGAIRSHIKKPQQTGCSTPNVQPLGHWTPPRQPRLLRTPWPPEPQPPKDTGEPPTHPHFPGEYKDQCLLLLCAAFGLLISEWEIMLNLKRKSLDKSL